MSVTAEVGPVEANSNTVMLLQEALKKFEHTFTVSNSFSSVILVWSTCADVRVVRALGVGRERQHGGQDRQANQSEVSLFPLLLNFLCSDRSVFLTFCSKPKLKLRNAGKTIAKGNWSEHIRVSVWLLACFHHCFELNSFWCVRRLFSTAIRLSNSESSVRYLHRPATATN
jgi:hypothetical protein